MYIPHAFREDARDTLVAFMRAHSFSTLVSWHDGAPLASHIPIAITATEDAITLSGHLARANAQWHSFGAGEALAIFHGPHAYVSPAHYTAHESVPTWNYIAVHAYGVPHALNAASDPDALETEMAALIATYEATYQEQWDSLPAKYRDGMLRGIVGFRLRVTRLEGKYKLSQNRSAADQHAVAAALLAHDDSAARATGMAMHQQLHPDEE